MAGISPDLSPKLKFVIRLLTLELSGGIGLMTWWLYRVRYCGGKVLREWRAWFELRALLQGFSVCLSSHIYL